MSKRSNYFFKTYILICIISFNLYSFSQEVIGTIIDSETKEGVIGSKIILKNYPQIGVITNIEGKFKIKANPNDTLIVSYIGYETVVVPIGNQKEIIIPIKLVGLLLKEYVVVGTRNPNRTSTESVVPVDVIQMDEIRSLGSQTSVNDILNMVAPSFTSQPQTVSDGTDHIDPASLRNLGPDQVLVLINGKRRHNSALVNINGTVGAGSVGTDMNAIPAAAIERIEVLRDGAAAQYGSDAIAGVINIVLKKKTDAFNFYINSGGNASVNSNDFLGGIDGEKLNIGANYGLGIGDKGGYICFTGDLGIRETSSRAKPYSGNIYNAYNGAERVFNEQGGVLADMTLQDYQGAAIGLEYLDQQTQDQISGLDLANEGDVQTLRTLLSGDATDQELAIRNLTRKDFQFKVGQSKLREGKFFVNMAVPITDHAEFYSFGGASYRQGLASGFYRRPSQANGAANTIAFPNGYLPQIGSDILDKSIVVGIRGEVEGWDIDFSNTWGTNSFAYTIYNSSNTTLGLATPREFDAGSNVFVQNTTNLDFSNYYDNILSGLNIAVGSKFRIDNYRIISGEEVSWQSYTVDGDPVTSVTPDSLKVVHPFTGTELAGGAQVFRGFAPQNELNKSRNNIAGYVDVELDVTKAIIVNGAVRLENYSDFGGTFNFKLASRYKFTKNASIRGSYSTGFRGPSLHQKYFSKRSTIFDANGNPEEEATFANNSRAAELLGIPELKEETSKNISAGITYKIPKIKTVLTLDVYQVDIEDRVVYTGAFSAGTNAELLAIFKTAEASKARFFANAIDTKSRGIDLVVSNKILIKEKFILKNDFSMTLSETKQVGEIKTTEKLKDQAVVFFGGRERLFLEAAQPRTKFNLTNILSFSDWSFMLRNVYFGEVTDPDSYADAQLKVYGAKVVTDLSLSYSVTSHLKLTVGTNNLFDVYPDQNRAASTASDQFIYSRRTSQFGYTGRLIFSRINFEF